MKNTKHNKSQGKYFAIIMAGGGGTRLWPISRQAHPKPTLVISGGMSLFQHSINRLKGLFPLERVLVVTNAEQSKLYKKMIPALSDENFLLEPEPKGTAAVVALSARVLFEREPESIMAVLTADHIIKNVKVFQEVLSAAYLLAQRDKLVTLGIEPTTANTGYGYIQFGDRMGDLLSLPAFQVIKFKEKPDAKNADLFIKSGDHAWNSGMFVWKTKTILDEFQRFMPDLFNKVNQYNLLRRAEGKIPSKEVWGSIFPSTIDYGIMEKSRNVTMIYARDLGWNDVGSWDSLFEVLPPDENGNIVMKGNIETIDVKGSLFHSEDSKKLIAGIHIKDMIIIDTKDALLVCPRKDSQRVREMVNLLKAKKKTRNI
jgi:mannose-1-phosphate guanylyltransferase